MAPPMSLHRIRVQWSRSSHNPVAEWRQPASRHWCPTCEFVLRMGAPCARRWREDHAPDMMGPNAQRAQNCKWPLTRLAVCCPYMSHLPTGTMAPKSNARRHSRRDRRNRRNGLCRSGIRGEKPAEAAQGDGIALEIIRLPEIERSFCPAIELMGAQRSVAQAVRCCRLIKDYERHASTPANLHGLACAGFMLRNDATIAQDA